MVSTAKYKWPVIFTLLVCAGLAIAFWPRAVPVELAQVIKGPMIMTVDDDGITRVKEVYTVTAPVAGHILRIEKHSGDAVAAGDIVAVILPAPPQFLDIRSQQTLKAALKAAQDARNAAGSGVDSAKATLDYAEIDEKRSRELLGKGAISQERLDQADRELRRAQASLSAAKDLLQQKESELEQAQAALLMPQSGAAAPTEHSVKIRAPESGKVLIVHQENETTVGAGAPVMDIGNPHDLEIAADFLSREAVKVAAGDAVFIENWGGDGALNGKVRLVEPLGKMKVSSLGIEEQRVNVIIDFTDPPEKWRNLAHGFQVDLRIVVWKSPNVLRIPMGALFRHGESWAVFRDVGGRAKLQDVKIGHMSGREAEVRAGLSVGDIVVVYPSDRITDGILIEKSHIIKP